MLEPMAALGSLGRSLTVLLTAGGMLGVGIWIIIRTWSTG